MTYDNFLNLIQFNVKIVRVQTESTKLYPNSTTQSQRFYRRVYELSHDC